MIINRIINVVLQRLGLMTIKRAKIFAAEMVASTARDIIHRVELGEHHGRKKENVNDIYISSANKEFEKLLKEASTLDEKVKILCTWEVE